MGIGRGRLPTERVSQQPVPISNLLAVLKSWQLWKMKFGKTFPDMRDVIK